MKKRLKTIGGMFLSMVILLSTLSSAGAVYAADAATGQYFQFTKFSTTQASPTTVNTSTVDVEGTFNGVSADSIYYQVDGIVNGSIVPGASGADVKPIIENEKNFRFPGVKLSQGLNRITVYGTTATGSLASGEAYVNFSNVPAIYNIALPDGTLLSADTPTMVNTAGLTLTLEAPNATEVMVNNTKMFNGGSSTFVIADIPLTAGLNKLTFVATTDSGTRTYAVTREVVYSPIDKGTPNKTKIGTYNLDDGNIVSATGGATQISGKLTGSITFRVSEDTAEAPLSGMTFKIRNTTTGNDVPVVGTTTIDATPVKSGEFITFKYTSTADVIISTNGKYTVTFTTGNGTYDGKSINPLEFTYRNANDPSITGVEQLYSPVANGNSVSYSSSGVFTGNSNLFELPLWLMIKTSETTTAPGNLVISSIQNGVPVSSGLFVTEGTSLKTTDGYRVFKITGLPTGEQTLQIDLKKNGSADIIDTKVLSVNYVSAPFIDVSNIYNNQVFKHSGEFTTINGRLVNFPAADESSVKITVNGTTAAPSITNHEFTFSTTGISLVSGPNKITIAGIANGVPVSTNLTVYLFPDNAPNIDGVVPYPAGKTSDPDGVFIKNSNLNYTTNESVADIHFVASNATQVVIMKDGKQYAVVDYNTDTSGGKTVGWKTESSYVIPPTSENGEFIIKNQELPTTGLQTFVISARLGTAAITQTLLITREVPPYSILSPKLPNESIIKQNFVDVSIQAEGATSIVIGKEAMIKGAKDIFRLELKGLKKGKNTIKFTVTTGTTKTNGTFDVTYSDEVLQGAQLKTTLNSSGKLTAFQNAVSLVFPKGTMLRDSTPTPGTTNTRQINLFNEQYILVGIADKQDGRTVKQYNPVGEFDGTGYQDGKLVEVPASSLAAAYMTPKLHYGYASNLYWIDPGYFVSATSINDYSTVVASHPYKKGNESFLGHMGRWMEPTQQGKITLKYDSSIVNAATSNISVWKNVDGTWYNMGGVVNTGSKTITATFDGFGYYTVMSLRYSYDDIVSHTYARSELETILSRGIMNAKDANEFGVYENVTRGEFATMLVKIMGIQLDYEPNNLTFSDVVKYSDYHWDYRYIETAVRKGIIRGTAPRIFSPNRTLSREDAAVMIARAMSLKLGSNATDLAALQKLFTDTGSIGSVYSAPSILAAYKAGVISGIENKLVAGQKKATYRFDPQANFTRADAAVMAQRIMAKMKRL
ncbi:S-layer homology domain-containing protein [Paenibacillus sp. FSL R10-2199]|uniref:S-layer homology domain-containing protein n=1 Tax=Paenibacillus sp. FSL R10-2199 TaxID=2975348 RepID=UPI0030FC8F3A